MTITEEPAVPTNAVPTPDNNLNDNKPCGFGRMLRKEDPRFVRGLGEIQTSVQAGGMASAAMRSSCSSSLILASCEST